MAAPTVVDRRSRSSVQQQMPSLSRRRTSIVDEEREPLFGASPHRWTYATNEAIWPGEESGHIAHPARACAEFPVFHTIHRFRRDVLDKIEDPYSPEQLRSPRLNKAVLRPLVDKYYDMDDLSVVFCILVNRFEFLREQADQPHQFTVANTRAMLCEIVASRILRRFDDNNTGPRGLLLLAHVLVAGFDPFQNASEATIREHSYMNISAGKREHARPLTALEVAIVSQSKTFLVSSPCQKAVEAIYQGRVVYSPTSFLDILPDTYKRKPIALYDPGQAPLLNQYRLTVPRTRKAMELIQYLVLLLLYVSVMNEQQYSDISTLEIVFDIYAWGWSLDQFASTLEHGWKVYTQNLWAFLDVMFMLDFFIYFVIRMNAHRAGNGTQAELAFSVLSAGAPVLIPRLAFNLLSENMLFLSLRAMMADFIVLTFLAVWCFAGFLLALNWLSHEQHPPITIAKWMLYVWFGLDGSGIQRSVDFHWLLGPILMVTFAFLGNTLFLTILVSMLSNTFASIVNNATAEIQFRRTVLTFESVKADAIFSFYPPFNLFALLILLPLKLILSPRWFHKVVVYTVRIINFPWLLLIGWFERRALWHEHSKSQGIKMKAQRWPWDMSKLAVHYDIQAVFEAEPPESVITRKSDDEDDGAGDEISRISGAAGKVKDVMAPIAQVAGQLQEVVRDMDAETHRERFDTIDAAFARLENLLADLAGRFGGKEANSEQTEEQREEDAEEEERQVH